MIVKELIEILENMHDNAEVMIIDSNGEYLKIVDVESENSDLVSIGADKQDD